MKEDINVKGWGALLKHAMGEDAPRKDGPPWEHRVAYTHEFTPSFDHLPRWKRLLKAIRYTFDRRDTLGRMAWITWRRNR